MIFQDFRQFLGFSWIISAMVHRLSDVYPTIGAPAVLGEVTGGLSRPRTGSVSVPDGPKKRFAKFKKIRKFKIFRFFRCLRVPSQQVVAAHASPADRLLVERPPSSGPPGSSFGSLIIKSTKAEHQKLHIFPFLAFLEPEGQSPGR